jgi:hypothetical protein
MKRHVWSTLLTLCTVAAGVLIVLYFTKWRHHRHLKPVPVSVHHATCWAHPGVFAHVDGRWVARYTPSGTRHGKGSVKGICNGKSN